MESAIERRARYSRAIEGEAWPCALVDLDAFERNVELLVRHATAHGKKLRVATKSLRVPDLVRRIVASTPGAGLMTYSARETAFLREQGFDDLLLAYPTTRRDDAALLAGLAARGAKLSVIVDDVAHLACLSSAAEAARTRIDVLVEVDMSYRPLRDLVLGVRRSPIREPRDVLAFVARVAEHPALRFAGIMGYEAQIAGVGDDLPGGPRARIEGALGRLVKSRSRVEVEKKRAEIVEALAASGHRAEIVNGGGTGNLTWCAAEPALTEVTSGSGFLCSRLFDRYREVRPEPAAWFALEIVRVPGPGYVTCLGGGYVASGPPAWDRVPAPDLPEGLQLLGLEGAGEVQTPLRGPPGVTLAIGEPVFFRHAKAGELAEHFAEYLLVRGDRIVDRAKTYRGFGQCFLG